jgi:hypothetical protein
LLTSFSLDLGVWAATTQSDERLPGEKTINHRLYVHRFFFPGQGMVMHLPDKDLLAANMILRQFLEDTKQWSVAVRV